jgi:hypothetical protein
MGRVMILRQTLFSVSALAALTMTASAADMPAKAPRVVEQPQQVSGYVELYGGWARTKQAFTDCDPGCTSGGSTASGWALGGAGRATWWWATNYSIQLDVQGEGTSHKHTFNGGGFSRVSSHSYLIGGHANWRDPGRGLIGIFGGAGDATNFFNDSVRHGLIGAEGQLYWGPVTLYAQGGYNSTLGGISSFGFDSIQAWFVRGTARVYATPNFRLEGTVLYADGDYDFVATQPGNVLDFQTWLWRAKGEYKFASAPFSVFALYEGSRTSFDSVSGPAETRTDRVTDHRIMGGIRLYLNENTLQWNDRNGTTLDIIAPFSAPSFTFARSPT